MSRPRSRWIAVLAIVLALLAIELSYWIYQGTGVYVQIINNYGEPISGVQLTADGGITRAGSIAPGGSVRAFVTARNDSPLQLQYRRPDGTSANLVVPMLDARYLRSEGRKFVLEVGADQFVQYSEEDEGRVNRLRQWPGKARRTISRWTFGFL
ncbi:hypothetical protein BH23PLA1_BH23PLA1_19310 [soil metagenome]